MTLKVASFFSGIGGFDLGFERSGMSVVFQCEKNNFCQRVLRKHWPTVFLWDDINTLTASSVPEVEVWCAGFPCQDVSLANQGKRRGFKGERSGLFYIFSKLLEEKSKKPKWVVIENVSGLLNSTQGKISEHSSPRWMNSGTAYRGEFSMQNILESPKDAGGCLLSEVIETKVPLRYFLGKDYLQSILTRAESRGKRLPPDLERVVRSQTSMLSNMLLLEEILKLAHKPKDTETTEKHGLSTQEGQQMLFVRRMTPLECEKIQGFPPGWTELDTEA